MAISFAVFLSYYRVLPPVTLTFPVELQFNSVWFSRLRTETRFLFSLSTSNMISKLILHLGIYASLTSAVAMICRQGGCASVLLCVGARCAGSSHPIYCQVSTRRARV
ncbi:hypothetical protein PybrP1_003103 [[Pythium] brassicae (nom. inval.)]|nr:hypothetical protein PybrP1_003103 [[Pythium] brassicae (nom. inval.)]